MVTNSPDDKIRRMQYIRGGLVAGALVVFATLVLSFMWIDRDWEPEEITLITLSITLSGGVLGTAAAFYYRTNGD